MNIKKQAGPGTEQDRLEVRSIDRSRSRRRRKEKEKAEVVQ